MKIQGIFFDLGRVLVGIDTYLDHLNKMERKIFGASHLVPWHGPQEENANMERGKETAEEFWRRAARRLRIASPPRAVARKIFNEPFKKYAYVNRKTLAIARGLSRAGYSIGIISNTINAHTVVMRKWKLFKYFDVVLLSNEIGMRKPEKEIFMLASLKMGIPCRNLLFIDDNSHWLAAARKCGFRTILFKSPRKLKKQLKRTGVVA